MNCYQIFSLSIYIFRTNKLPLARVIAVIAFRHLAACSGNQGTEVGEFSERHNMQCAYYLPSSPGVSPPFGEHPS